MGWLRVGTTVVGLALVTLALWPLQWLAMRFDWPIATVAARCGIPNAANFNRQFLAARGMTPGAYRQFFARHGHAPDADAPAPLDTRPPSLERSTGPGRPRPHK